jgi:hypothetical protein
VAYLLIVSALIAACCFVVISSTGLVASPLVTDAAAVAFAGSVGATILSILAIQE